MTITTEESCFVLDEMPISANIKDPPLAVELEKLEKEDEKAQNIQG